MKILQVNTLYPPQSIGGAERTAAILGQELVDRGHSVAVASITDAKVATIEEQGLIRVYRTPLKNLYWPFPTIASANTGKGQSSQPKSSLEKLAWHTIDRYNPWMKSAFEAIVEKEKPDLVMTHNLQGWSCSVWQSSVERKIPIIHALHDHSLICPTTVMYRDGANCDRPCGRCAWLGSKRQQLSQKLSGVASVSHRLLERHLEFGAVPHSVPNQVIHNGLSDSVSRIALPRDAVRTPFRIGFLGRVEEPKGIQTLIDAVRELRREVGKDQFMVRVAGSGQQNYIDGLLSQAGDCAIEFLGRQPAQTFLDSIDLLVVPTIVEEGLGNVAFEAMARGAAVIVSNSGGLPEIVEHGRSGWLMRPGDAKALSQQLARCVREPAHVLAMAKVGWERSAYFNRQRQALQLWDFVDRVMS